METKRRVLLLGDSIAFSRSNHAQIFSDAWPVKVKEALPDYDIWQRCRPAATILEVKNEFGLFKSHIAEFSPVIIQVGITDACPRPFPYLFQRLLSMFASPEVLRWIGSRYHRLLKFRSRPWISEQEFQSVFRGILEEIFSINTNCQIGVVRIVDAGPSLVEKVSQIQVFVSRYNSLIEYVTRTIQNTTRVTFLNPFVGEDVSNLLLPDGHHLSANGHTLVARAVVDFLSRR